MMLYPPGSSSDVTLIVLNSVMVDQFDDVRECAHCQVRLMLHLTCNTPHCILLRVVAVCARLPNGF